MLPFVQTARVFRDDRSDRATELDNVCSRIEIENVLVIDPHVALLENGLGNPSGSVRARNEGVGPILRPDVSDVEEEFEPFDPVHIEMEELSRIFIRLRGP